MFAPLFINSMRIQVHNSWTEVNSIQQIDYVCHEIIVYPVQVVIRLKLSLLIFHMNVTLLSLIIKLKVIILLPEIELFTASTLTL